MSAFPDSYSRYFSMLIPQVVAASSTLMSRTSRNPRIRSAICLICSSIILVLKRGEKVVNNFKLKEFFVDLSIILSQSLVHFVKLILFSAYNVVLLMHLAYFMYTHLYYSESCGFGNNNTCFFFKLNLKKAKRDSLMARQVLLLYCFSFYFWGSLFFPVERCKCYSLFCVDLCRQTCFIPMLVAPAVVEENALRRDVEVLHFIPAV